MLDREIIAVCSQIHTKHINTLREQNAELLNVERGGFPSVNTKFAVLTATSHRLNVIL